MGRDGKRVSSNQFYSFILTMMRHCGCGGLDWICGCGKEAIIHISWKGMQLYFCKDCLDIWEEYYG